MTETQSQKQERQIKTNLVSIYGNARTQPGSGNQATAPNDVVVVNIMHVECKTTSAKSMTLKHSWIAGAKKLAMQFAVPAYLAIRFNSIESRDYFVIDDGTFYNLLRIEKEHTALVEELRQKAKIA